MKRVFKLFLAFSLLLAALAITVFAAEKSVAVYLDNELVEFDVEPQIISGRTMVPVRAIFEKLGAKVSWDDATKTAIATKGSTEVRITVNAPEMTVNGAGSALDSPAVIIDSRTLVPLRAVSTAFGCEVGWHSTERRVSLISDTEKFVMLYSGEGSVSASVSEACAICDKGWFLDVEMSKKAEHSLLNGVCSVCKMGMTVIQNGTLRRDSYYCNKIEGSAADPFILEHNGTYYLYATGGSRFTVRKSQNLIRWTSASEPILKLSDTTWAVKSGWAPEVYEYNGKFYFIFSAQNANDIHCIDIAVSDTPDGKFVPLSDKPFFAPGYSVIDASLFFDDDGKIYLYYSKDCSTNKIGNQKVSQSYGVEIKKDFSGIIGDPVLISTPTYEWELKSGNTLWNEGPVVFKENGIYYQLFSANFYQSQHYSVGYTSSDTPLRLFDKTEDSKILSGNGSTVTGPGHCNIFRSPENGEIYLAYHVHTVPPNTEHGRSLAIDRLIVHEDGTLSVDGPSETMRPLPSGINGYCRVESGYTYTADGLSSMLKRGSAVEHLFDKNTCSGASDILSLNDGGSISIKFDKPTSLNNVWVIPSIFPAYLPGSADLEINGKYIIEDVKFKDGVCEPVVFTLDTLPEGTLVEDLKITVHTAEGKSYCVLSEIVFIDKK